MGTAPGEKVRDVRGIEIEPGDRVVRASSDRRLHLNVVKTVEATQFPLVRFADGGYTTPDRIAVVQKATTPEPREVRET